MQLYPDQHVAQQQTTHLPRQVTSRLSVMADACRILPGFIMLGFTGDEQKEIPLLGSTVQSVLAQAEAHGMQSIAMPLIGHGLAGWPAKLAARLHVEQVLCFFKAAQAGPSSLQVHQAG